MEEKEVIKSNLIEIPIQSYEEYMNSEASKGKKEEILEILQNHNKLKSLKEYKEIQYKLYDAISRCDLDLIKIYLSETVENDSKDMSFKIDETNKTASLFQTNAKIDHIIVPRTIKYKSDEYLVTSISGINTALKTIKFELNSAVRILYGNAFESTYIEQISFPSSLIKLKDGWCKNANFKMINSNLNRNFVFKENKYLLGKSDNNKGEFDTLLFVRRDIKEFEIPSNIKIISPYAFYSSRIQHISLSPSVLKIGDAAFFDCCYLKTIEIPENSNLQSIGENAFQSTIIEELYIPSSLNEIKSEWNRCMEKLTKITVSPLNDNFMYKDNKYLLGKSDNSKGEFDVLLYVQHDITEIEIPSNIKIIKPFALYFCTKIQKVSIPSSVSQIGEFAFNCNKLSEIEIPANSNLQAIENCSFTTSLMNQISIPSSVSKICKCAFYGCRYLKTIEIPENSNLQTIEIYAFQSTAIEKIYFPSSLIELKDGWCCGTEHLNKILISPLNDKFEYKDNKYLLGKSDNNKGEFDTLLFVRRDIQKLEIPSNIKIISPYAFHYSEIEQIKIPSSVTRIGFFAFSDCRKLRKVEFSKNSNLRTIEECAFSRTGITEISIPSSVLLIYGYGCFDCKNLKIIDLPTNSNLQEIDENAFGNSNNKGIFIPSSVSIISESAFNRTIQIIEFSENVKPESFSSFSLKQYPNLILMIPLSLAKLIQKDNIC